VSRLPLFLVALAILLLAGCGGSTHSPGSGSTTRTGTTSTRTSGSTDVRLPATFTILSGDRLTPASVSAPASLAIQVTVVSGDGKSHRVLLRTPTPYALAVRPGGRASVLVGGLRPGRYVLLLDRAARGALVVGGQPGP
jgi:hypothetical protein